MLVVLESVQCSWLRIISLITLQPSKPLRIKTLKLSEITKPLEKETATRMMAAVVKRILQAEKVANMGGAAKTRVKIITTLASTFHPEVSLMLVFVCSLANY